MDALSCKDLKIFPVASKNTHKIGNVKQQLGTVSYRRTSLVWRHFGNQRTEWQP